MHFSANGYNWIDKGGVAYVLGIGLEHSIKRINGNGIFCWKETILSSLPFILEKNVLAILERKQRLPKDGTFRFALVLYRRLSKCSGFHDRRQLSICSRTKFLC